MDFCEIFVVSKASNAIFSYVLKCANISRDVVDLDGMKVVGISRTQKWWKKLSDSVKFIHSSMLEVYCGLSPLEVDRVYGFLSTISNKGS